ncbi:MAG: dihydroflavonol 4-reductase, partial [Bdellovibrio sp.]
PGERYILSGENLTIQQLFTLIAETGGVVPPNIRLPSLLLHTLGIAGDLATKLGWNSSLSRENAWTATLYHWFDCSKAKRELGFDPGSARDAIRDSVTWMKARGLLKTN